MQRRHSPSSTRAWCALGCRSFYFPSISFLSGFPSAFPLILKQEHSLARAVSKRVAVVFQAAHDSVEVPTGKDESGSLKDHSKEGLKEFSSSFFILIFQSYQFELARPIISALAAHPLFISSRVRFDMLNFERQTAREECALLYVRANCRVS